MSLGMYSQLIDVVFRMVSWLIPLLLLIESFKILFLSILKGQVGERQVQNQLKKLDLEAIHDVILPDGSGGLTQIDHIVLLYDGILVIETKNYQGLLYGNASDSTWTHKIGGKTHRPQNPLRQNKLHIRAIQALRLGVPITGLVVFTNKSKFPKGVPTGVIQLKNLRSQLEHHKFSEPITVMKDAWKILKFNARNDKKSKKEHMAQIKNKYGKDKRRYAAYILLPISIIWLLGNLASNNNSTTNLSYAKKTENHLENNDVYRNNSLQQDPKKTI